MDSINFAFIVPGDSYDDDCHRCEALWEESEKRPEDIRIIRSAHNSCHGWNHCHIDCCGPCPYCGYCDGLDDWDLDENEVPEDPEYSESKLQDNILYSPTEWDSDRSWD